MIYYILIVYLLYLMRTNASFNVSNIDERTVVSEVIDLSWNFATNWNISQSAIFILDIDEIMDLKNVNNIPIVIYSPNHIYGIKTPLLCDDTNTIDYHPTIMLLLF